MSTGFNKADEDKRSCPDDGTCHHFCESGPCFRVQVCGPLSGVFPDNRWPEDVRENEKAREQLEP